MESLLERMKLGVRRPSQPMQCHAYNYFLTLHVILLPGASSLALPSRPGSNIASSRRSSGKQICLPSGDIGC